MIKRMWKFLHWVYGKTTSGDNWFNSNIPVAFFQSAVDAISEEEHAGEARQFYMLYLI